MSVTGKVFNFTLFKRVFSYVKPYKTTFTLSLSTTILFAIIAPIRPELIKYTIDHFIINPDKQMLLIMTLIMIGILLTEAILQFYDSILAARLGQNVIRDIRSDLFKHIINLKLKYFDNTPIGTLVTRTVSDIETIADIFSEGLIVIIGDLLKLSVIIVVMFYTNVTLALVSLTTIPVLLIATYIFKNAVKTAFQDVRNQVAKLNAFVQEHITGMNIIQIFNREEVEYQKFKEINQKHTDANIRSVWHYSVFFPIVEILSSVSLGLLVWWGGKNALQHITSAGELVSFIFYINMLFRPIRQLADRFNTLQMGMVGSERVFKLFDNNETITENGTLPAKNIHGHIQFNGVWFAYNDENWVLRNIHFEIKPGESIAIVGATGAGKSSIINLLNRMYEYNKGDILIDGHNIRDYKLNELRQKIGTVLQDVFLFSGSIAENISIGNPEITREKIISAAKEIGAHDFIMKLPGGYDYNVMERGAMLSAGQRQIISFIRVYVYNPSILVLDEATSSIDHESELLIQNATTKLMQNRSSIIIAHRLSTIKNANRILVLDHGQIIESGTHEELMNKNGQYRKLVEIQLVSRV